MCTQTHFKYACGCTRKGEFEQCDRLYDLNVNLQCAATAAEDKPMRSYCAKHLLKEGKATEAYRVHGPKCGQLVTAGKAEEKNEEVHSAQADES